MRFNSPAFLLALPLVCLLYWRLPARVRGGFLLLVSWGFYALYDLRALVLLLSATALSWLCAAGMARHPRARGGLLALCLAGLLGTLGLFKYAGALGLPLPLPVGISFYTFQTLSYVLDVYRGQSAPERSFPAYALFVSFFPQLVAGPIERPEALLPQLRAPRPLTAERLRAGLWLLLSGYFRKIVLADSLAPLVDRVYRAPGTAAGSEIAAATVLFGLQIYCDFSGYTDIARGCGALLGVDLSENFRQPYAAVSIRDFWRRWHISLTRWFTDYVYIPLGGSRGGLARQCANLLLVFLLSGIWHGAGWTFLIWGALHGGGQVVELLSRRAGLRPPRPLARALTLLAVNFAWLFFRAECLADARALLRGLAHGWLRVPLSLPEAARVAVLLLCLHLLERPAQRRALAWFALGTAVWLSWLAHLAVGGGNAFVYFQF